MTKPEKAQSSRPISYAITLVAKPKKRSNSLTQLTLTKTQFDSYEISEAGTQEQILKISEAGAQEQINFDIFKANFKEELVKFNKICDELDK